VLFRSVFDTFGNDPQVNFAGADLAVNGRIECRDDGSMVLYDVINADNLLYAFALGPVALYYAGSVRFQTSNAGATVTGVLKPDGIQAGATATAFDIKTSGNEDGITINNDGSVELFYNNVKRFETSSDGASVTGDLSVSGNLTLDGTSGVLATSVSYR